MADHQHLRLTAQDTADLTVISACLQDALARGTEMTFEPKLRRFAAIFNRFRWENHFEGAGAEAPGQRVRAGVHFDSVQAVQSRGIDRSPQTILQLLAVEVIEGEDGAAEIRLEFAGGGSIRLEVECIDCYLSDFGAPWRALRTPEHSTEEEMP